MNKFYQNKTEKRILRPVFFMLLFALSTIIQAQGISKQQLFSFNLQNTTFENVLKHIERNSRYVFMYSDLQDKSQSKVSIKANNLTINQVLDQLMSKINGTYEIDGYQIVLKKKVIKTRPENNRIRKNIHGLVTDAMTQEPIIGAAVMIKGTTTGAATSIEGDFTLECCEGDTLSVSYIGYEPKDIVVKGLNIYSITLSEDAKQLEEVVVTAFGTGQKKISMVGAVTQIKSEELRVPSASLSSSFAGRLAGVIAVQRSGEPGADGANFWIRGKSTFSGVTDALIVLDGVEISSQELNALDPEAIESFSILKDATATALYGTRGANGVMIVTTKNGKNLDKPIINFRLEGALTQLTQVPEMADGVTYMKMYNESLTRPYSSGTPYSEDKINGTINNLNPYIYPNVDWYNEMFKRNAFSQKANFNIRGGSNRMDYFMSAGIKHSGGNLKSLSRDYFSYDNNIQSTNYDFINNLNVQATPTTKLSLGLNLSINDWKGPSMSPDDIFAYSKIANPVDFPVLFPAGSGGIETEDVMWGAKNGGPYDVGYRNPVAEYVRGYKTKMQSIITSNFKINQDLSMLLPGLTFSGLFSFKNRSITYVTRESGYNGFELDSYNPENMDYVLRYSTTEQDTTIKTSGEHGGERKMYLQAILDYKNIFNDIHDLNVMFLFNREQYNTNTPVDLYTSLPKRKQGIAGRISYAYNNRYLAEINFGYNGSENFAPGNRYGFFPSFALGYNISEEKFWDKIRPIVSKFKIRSSWGLVGNDNTGAGRFSYLEDLLLNDSPSYTTGIKGEVSSSGPKWKRYFNSQLSWEIGEKYNVGLDLGFFDSLNLSFEVFKEIRRNIFLSRGNTIPGFIGLAGAQVFGNLGKMKNEGIDFSLDYNKQVNRDFFISFKSTFTYAHNTILERDEPPFREYPNLSSVGHSIDQNLLYIANGLFPDEQTIKNNPSQNLGFTPQPGDIWYKNLPNHEGEYDNVIDSNDRMYVGNPSNPEIVYGFGPSIKWKNWDFSCFFQGVAKTSILMSNIHPFGSQTINGLFQWIVDDHWSLENPDLNAGYPRLTQIDNPNNTKESTYWLRNGAFLKLKNAEIGYNYKGWRFYISGSNLLTFSPFKYWDPEMGNGSGLKYPTQRVFNFGIQVIFNNK